MASTRQFRKKIKSAKSIAKITRAMQMVAASKMKRAQLQAEAGRDYARGLIELSGILSTQFDEALHPLMTVNHKADKKLIIVIAPEKGLCGSLITNLNKKLWGLAEYKNTEYIAVGKKAIQTVKRLGKEIVAEFTLGIAKPSYEIVPVIAKVITDRYLTGEIKEVDIIYSKFLNTMSQQPALKIILPLHIALSEEEQNTANEKNARYLFEPSSEKIIESLLNRYLEVEIYQLLLEAYASEQSARMVAMKNATDNAQGLIEDLTIKYNKARQALITNEIIDISSANTLVQ